MNQPNPYYQNEQYRYGQPPVMMHAPEPRVEVVPNAGVNPYLR